MKKILFFSAMGLLLIFSCKKDNNSNTKVSIPLKGIFTETSPVAGRAQLNFVSDKMLIKSETGSVYRDTFTYTITDKKINLKHITSVPNSESQENVYAADYERLDANKFKIQNLYPQIPEAPESFMIFSK